MADADNRPDEKRVAEPFAALFYPNTETNRRRLNIDGLYLTIFYGATTICRSIYLGDDQWMNPRTGTVSNNAVAYFMTARVLDIPGFPGWPI